MESREERQQSASPQFFLARESKVREAFEEANLGILGPGEVDAYMAQWRQKMQKAMTTAAKIH